MKLSNDESAFLDSLYNEKFQPLSNMHITEQKKIDYDNQIRLENKFNLYAEEVKRYAREAIEAYIQAFMETYHRIGKYPDEDDYNEFLGRLDTMAERFMDCFPGIYKSVYSPMPSVIVNRRLEILLQELRQIVGESIPPLHRFMKEAKITNNTKKKRQASIHNPWLSGSFYLFAAIIVLTALAVISKTITLWALPLVLIGGILIITIIGAFQLKNDNALKDESFVTLMIETLKRLPLLRRFQNGKDKDKSQTSAT